MNLARGYSPVDLENKEYCYRTISLPASSLSFLKTCGRKIFDIEQVMEKLTPSRKHDLPLTFSIRMSENFSDIGHSFWEGEGSTLYLLLSLLLGAIRVECFRFGGFIGLRQYHFSHSFVD